ncbi:PREDICTED: uncharacterized protein LOC105461525, partial [Wasmannia auropunctata]|uniref:uncharacterized protein LOC105461525 n=1 Tax=Wasmannia auropunctata TaxID=64793 RepID=UPI0005EF6123
MRKFAEECNASSSTTLRGTILRKHIATYCIQLNLNDVEVSDLATFMGHADKIHKEHYRQPQASRDILKISQYLEAVQGDAQDNESSSDYEDENLNDSFNDIDYNDTTIDIAATKNVSSCIIQEASTSYQDNNKKRKRS